MDYHQQIWSVYGRVNKRIAYKIVLQLYLQHRQHIQYKMSNILESYQRMNILMVPAHERYTSSLRLPLWCPNFNSITATQLGIGHP